MLRNAVSQFPYQKGAGEYAVCLAACVVCRISSATWWRRTLCKLPMFRRVSPPAAPHCIDARVCVRGGTLQCRLPAHTRRPMRRGGEESLSGYGRTVSHPPAWPCSFSSFRLLPPFCLCFVHSASVDWKVIANITGRTTKQCRERWINVLDPTILVSTRFFVVSDLFLSLLLCCGFSVFVFSALRSRTLTGRRVASLPQRTKWTEEEIELLFRSQMELGNRWSQIAARIEGRPGTCVVSCRVVSCRAVVDSLPRRRHLSMRTLALHAV